MSQEAPPFTVIQGGAGNGPEAPLASTLSSPQPPPLINLSSSERRIWKYICDSLAQANLEHITAGLPIAIIVRTYSDWIKASAECERKKTRYQVSANGWSTEAPWAADERRLKQELGQWLPKACLTIPSITRVKKDLGIASGQDDLFADLVRDAQSKPNASAA